MNNELLRSIDDLESLSIIKEGLYKDTYRCLYRGRRAILSHYRIDSNPFNLDPKREISLLNTIEYMNLTPEPLFYDDESKILIVTEVEGSHVSQTTDRKVVISKLGKSLISLHSHPADDFEYSFHDSLMAYGSQLKDEEEKSIFRSTIELHDVLMDKAGKHCLCHNDLHPENLLIDDRIQFIDWEYASLNIPHFDLAYAIDHFEMTEDEIAYFMSEYGIQAQNIDFEILQQTQKLTKYVSLIWLLILNKCYTIKSSEAELMTSLKKQLNV
tara:strand:- start:4819 stop:5628 length:810 start_codon:yes stop_codon:yes gene_type:complete